MLDLPRLERLRLVRYPVSQRFFGCLLHANYRWWPGVRLALEDAERIPDEPVIFAMNHTDRYNYLPFQYLLWQAFDRFTATWVKGKYYENALLAQFMESMDQLPTVSRGYLITRDFVGVHGAHADRPGSTSCCGRRRCARGRRTRRDARAARGAGDAARKPRNPFGCRFDPARGGLRGLHLLGLRADDGALRRAQRGGHGTSGSTS